MRLVLFSLLLFSLFSTAGCARMMAADLDAPYDEAIREEAREMLETVIANNPLPSTFKGIGDIKLTRDSITQSSRMAWAASVPDEIRIELLTPYGQPSVSLSSDGRYVYVVLHQDKSFYKKNVSETSFERILSIPIGPEEIVSILGGRPPIIEYSFVSKIESEIASGPVIVARESWWGDYQKIYFSEDGRQILGAETFNGAGELKYKVFFAGFRKVEKFYAPSRVVISSAEGAEALLNVSRFWAGADVSPSAFVLEPPVE